MRSSFYGALVSLLLISQLGIAQDAIPVCPAFRLRQQNGSTSENLGINNAQVLGWKKAAVNLETERGHVQGQVIRLYPDRNNHQHFAIKIGPGEKDTIEVIYNQDFGAVPEVKLDMPVEACGDYITSIAPSPGPGGQTYPASPDGAIIHWVHMAPGSSGHNSGFLVVNGTLTGQDAEHAPPRPPHHDQ